MTTTPSFAFNTLLEPSSSVTDALPKGFDTGMAYLCASATSAAVQLYAQGITTLTQAMLSALPLTGGAQSYQQLATFTAPEAVGFGASAATPGAFIQATIGIAIQGVDSKNNALFTVIALRGTQTYQEWVNDLTVLPASYALVSGAGTVHGGFYAVYTNGPDGQAPTKTNPRVTGSLADQVYQAVQTSSWPTSVPLYITGHSLGAALAELCAMDIASNVTAFAKSCTMIALAPPQVSAGILDDGNPFFYSPTTFQSAYQAAVPKSFAVVNAADIVPILPATLGSSTSYQLVFLPVVPASDTIMYCAQLGDIASNHELTLNYLPYLEQLASGFAKTAARPFRPHAPASAAPSPAPAP